MFREAGKGLVKIRLSLSIKMFRKKFFLFERKQNHAFKIRT